MPSLFLPLVLRLPRLIPRNLGSRLSLAALLLAGGIGGPVQAAPPAQLAGSGIAIVPADAAFFSASLRLREQYDRIVGSNAFAALRALPGVERALASWDEQREMPGSPVSMFLTFLELPENEQAAELLADMVATDTFVYGTESWVNFARLIRVVQRAQQVASLLEAAADGGFLEIEESEMIDEDDAEAAAGRPRTITVRGQVELDLELPVGRSQRAAIIKELAANPDLIVVPDVVWGFKTAKKEIAAFQIKRLEVLAKMLVDVNPALAGSLARRKVPGGEIVSLTLDGDLLPWDDLLAELRREEGDAPALMADVTKLIDRARGLDLVIAFGLIGDRVILSLGDSTDHLEQLVTAEGKGKPLLDTAPLAPLLDHAANRLTGISFMSQPLVAALAASADDLDPLLDNLDAVANAGGFSHEAAADARTLLERAKRAYGDVLPRPGAWTSVSFLADQGYEGYVWDWSQNHPVDGGRRLDLLDHVGGNPLAAVVGRLAYAPGTAATIHGLLRDGWTLLAAQAREKMDEDDRKNFDRFADQIVPLGSTLFDTIGTKFGPSLADGQIGLVLDGQATTRRLHADLPQAAEPLPIVEPAILLPLADRRLFVEGLNDVFEVLDELVVRLRKLEPDAIPAGYEIPAPVKQKLEQGTVWAFPLGNSGLDAQIQPAIVVGDDLAAFTLVPGQAERLLAKQPLATAKQLAKFNQPAAAAAAVEWSRLVDALEPWLVYLTRYGSVMQREGDVDPSLELTAGTETPEVSEALEHLDVILDVARCLRAAAATTVKKNDALVTHWRNEIRDLPAK
ncbi:MAG: hypothetical protein RLZZ440_1793 [Planctomycetota bacterium]